MTFTPVEPPPPRPSRSPSRSRSAFAGFGISVPRSTVALLFVSILLPLLLFALAAQQNRRDVERAAELRVERTTRILHEHALKVFETHQLMIDQINERLLTLNWSDSKDVENLHQILRHMQALLPQIAAIVITDADGNLRADSLAYPVDRSINYADRDYFKVLKAKDQELPYISRATMGRRTGDPVFNMAARAKGPVKDRFDGVVSVSINQGYFSEFYRGTEREYAHLVILAREDGNVLASEPPVPMRVLPSNGMFRLALESKSNGFQLHPSMVDGTERIFGYEKVGIYPVVVGFGVTWKSAMLPWWRNMWGYGLVAGLSSLALLAVSGFAIRRIALEGRATVRWRRSAALLETEMAQRVKIEDQLRQSQKMEAVGRLTGGIAHDFNNLLTVVIGSLDLLSRRMKDADPRHQTLVKNAVDGATRAASLTARLLAFSRQQPLEPRPIDANALITDMSSLLQRTLGETVSIDCRLDPALDRTFADPNQLENAILNLCVNAVDAMPKGGTLTVATANAALDGTQTASHPDLVLPELVSGSYVTIAVIDTGTGMPPEVLARAFEPFFTTKPVGKGTGLGLSQVYGFARQSGGDVTIRSEVGVGTTIMIRLPRLTEAQTSLETVAPSTSADPTSMGRPGSATILIVEDEELVRSFSSAALRDAGYTVLEAGTGPEGLKRLREAPEIALLFTDVVLKGPMNGRELADEAGILRPGLPVLFTTGYTKDAIVHDGRLDEGVSFIGKPFTTAALTSKIEELLDLNLPEARRSAVG